ncbi:MAG: glycosyltransferase family 2 protein [Candidatus Omnitrophica bacterium]|nr:glycosyltransferase family 2 protein [Candidatus Omnitrophota bacterium]
MVAALWILIFLVVWCYLLYPVSVAAFARAAERKVAKGEYCPTVSVVISVWNEEDVIEAKLRNFLALDYPADNFEILIGSDGSTDRTNAIVKSFTDPRVRLIEHGERRGKMATLNDLVAKARHEVIVFTDARQEFAADAIRQLVANFADPAVGCVSGELMFSRKEGATARGINLYWNYEKFMRKCESRIHSMLGATGAVYAIRKALYPTVPVEVVLDDVYIPLKIVQQGYRAIFDGEAKAYDEVADSPREEYRRKARTLFGNWQVFRIFIGLFNPFTSPVAVQFFSHKFLRVAAPFLLIGIFCLNLLLWSEPLYRGLMILQLLFYAMAAVGGLARHQKYGMLRILSKVCYIPYVFCLLNFSALIGFVRFMSAGQQITWEKARAR